MARLARRFAAVGAAALAGRFSVRCDSAPSNDAELDQRFLASRRIFLLEDVGDDSANRLVKRLLYLEQDKPGEPIELIINSSGGSLWSGFALVDMMRCISSPVHTICVGRCRSMAAVILAAGEPGHRYTTASARIMIHQPKWDSGIFPGADATMQADDLRSQALESERQRQHWAATIAQFTGQDAKVIDEKMVRDVHMTAEEAQKLGVVDYIVESIKGAELITPAPKRSQQSVTAEGSQDEQ